MIIGQFTLGTGLNCIRHELGVATKVGCYVHVHLLVHPNISCGGANVAHKICLFFRIDLVGNRTIHKPVLEIFLPSVTIVLLYVLVTPIPHASNTTFHPGLHSVTTDMSEYAVIPGMTWPVRAALGSCGRSSYYFCVEVSLEPSGIVTVTGFVATDIPVADVSVTRK